MILQILHKTPGEGNAYFRRTQPAEEHPENENFVAREQEGGPGKEDAETNIPGPNELPDQQKVGEDNKGTHSKSLNLNRITGRGLLTTTVIKHSAGNRIGLMGIENKVVYRRLVLRRTR